MPKLEINSTYNNWINLINKYFFHGLPLTGICRGGKSAPFWYSLLQRWKEYILWTLSMAPALQQAKEREKNTNQD